MALNKITAAILFALLISSFGFYRGCQNQKEQKETAIEQLADYKANLKHIEDSIKSLVPDTIKLPGKVIKGDPVYITIYDTTYIPSTAKDYTKSLKNDSIDVTVFIKADNLYSLAFEYKPITIKQTSIIEKPIPYAVIQKEEVKVPQNGFFVSGGLGYGSKSAIQLQLLYLNKKGNMFGPGYMRYGNENIWLINCGVKL